VERSRRGAGLKRSSSPPEPCSYVCKRADSCGAISLPRTTERPADRVGPLDRRPLSRTGISRHDAAPLFSPLRCRSGLREFPSYVVTRQASCQTVICECSRCHVGRCPIRNTCSGRRGKLSRRPGPASRRSGSGCVQKMVNNSGALTLRRLYPLARKQLRLRPSGRPANDLSPRHS
jgi:hypothetical protein